MKNIELSKEKTQDLLTDIKDFYYNERNEEISDFQAASFLEFILDKAGPYIYNQAIDDAHKLMSDKVEDLYALEKRSR